jgi:transposase
LASAARFAEHLRRKPGTDVHPETVRDALGRLEYSPARPRRTLQKGPDYAERLQKIDEAVACAGPDTTVLYADETELRRFPPPGRQWQPVGEQRAVRVPYQNDDFALQAALDVCTGTTYTRAFEKSRSDYTVQFLEMVETCTEEKVLLIWDQASWHTSKKVQETLGRIGRIETLLLPARAPEANPTQDLWRELKEQIAACLERSIGALVASARRYFERLGPMEALRVAGIASG